MAAQMIPLPHSLTALDLERLRKTACGSLCLNVSLLVFCLCTTRFSCAQEAAKPGTVQPQAPVTRKPSNQGERFPIREDVNGFKTVIPAARFEKPVRFAIYQGKGSSDEGLQNVMACLAGVENTSVSKLSAEDFRNVDLSQYGAVIFSGGVASAQSESLGETGRNRVREYVRSGGGYVGICAGAYLACSNFSWGLGLLNASTVSSQWRRGQAWVQERLTGAGTEVLGEAQAPFFVRYNNGPILKPAERKDIPAYVALAVFETEVAENETPAGIMINSPAQAIAHFGSGRVFVSSPHPENTPGLVHLIPRGLSWVVSGKSTALKAESADQ
jgi:glutamine amidotransferase-like uncharacterized protein